MYVERTPDFVFDEFKITKDVEIDYEEQDELVTKTPSPSQEPREETSRKKLEYHKGHPMELVISSPL